MKKIFILSLILILGILGGIITLLVLIFSKKKNSLKCSKNSDCSSGEICQNKTCISQTTCNPVCKDSCSQTGDGCGGICPPTISCKKGEICQDGKCVNSSCNPICKDSCSETDDGCGGICTPTISCKNGEICQDGKCFFLAPFLKPRIIGYVKNFGDLTYGQPLNYTHIIIGFACTYQYWMGTGSQGHGCSKKCNISYSTYYNNMPTTKSAIQLTADVVNYYKNINPNIKVLLSFGGWNFSALTCNYVCSGDEDPLNYLPSNSDCTLTNSNSITPRDYCYGSEIGSTTAKQNGIAVANKLISMCKFEGLEEYKGNFFDGVDIDIEDTTIFNSAETNTLKQNAYDFISSLTTTLKNQGGTNFIVSHSPLNTYLMREPNSPYYNSYLFYSGLLQDIRDSVDFIIVQYYNSYPEDSVSSAWPIIVNSYNDIVINVMSSGNKVVIGMCISQESGTCQKCTSLQEPYACSNLSDRVENILKPLYCEYGQDFGGVMFRATTGDVAINGVEAPSKLAADLFKNSPKC